MLGLYTDDLRFGVKPDSLNDFLDLSIPADDFVLCRDRDGTPTAVYSEDKWDFNAYRTSATLVPVFSFDLAEFVPDPAYAELLKAEIKWLLFCCIYKPNPRSALGRLSVKTLYSYHSVLKNIAKFTYLLSKNEFIKQTLTVKTLLTTERHVHSLFKYSTEEKQIPIKNLNAVINRLAELGKEKIGYAIVYHYVDDERDDNQHPIIPAALYLYFVNKITEQVELFDKSMGQIDAFLSEFKDPYFGSTHSTQKVRGVSVKELRPTLSEAIAKYDLSKVFENVVDKHALASKLRQIQFTLKCGLHLYSGMRDQEVLRLPYDCIAPYTDENEQKDDEGKVVVQKKVIQLLSTTTKYVGYKKDDSWYASGEVIKIVNLLKKITKGLSAIKDLNADDCPLFLNVAILSQKNFKIGINEFKKSKLKKPDWLLNSKISENDFELLKASDPERDFESEPEFAVGNPWPLTSHQFRRSLAFYASNTGFVSLPTLNRQFKHLTKEITRYYGRNFENVKTIFGHYDEKSGEYVLPKSHVIFECQAAVPTSTVNRLLDDIMGDEALFGKTGGYISKQRDRLFNGEVQIAEFRADTEKKVAAGEMAYNKTLLGGCTNVDGCDCRILGEFTDCLGSDCAVIKKENVEAQILEIQAAMKKYTPNDGEYQVLEVELNSLLKFKKYRMNSESLA